MIISIILGGVNVYQRNLIDTLKDKDDKEVFFLSAGLKYNPLRFEPYIIKTKNVYGQRVNSFEIVNSTIMAPAYVIFKYPRKYIDDRGSEKILSKFIDKYGPFDVVHFNNLEGLSVNVLRLKRKYNNIKFIVSVHNYQLICPLCQYFQNHNGCNCYDFKNGTECLKCAVVLPSRKEYYRRCKEFFFEKVSNKYLRVACKLLSKLFIYRCKRFTGNNSTMSSEDYMLYRKHNVEILNRYADVILAVSERVKHLMINNGCDEKKIVTSYIGTKFADIQLGHSVTTITNDFTIAYLGYERIDKGYFFMLDALSKMPDNIAKKVNVVLAVRNINQANYEDKLKKFKRVCVYNGYIHSDLPRILHNVNLGIIPVLWEDNLPQVAIEMAANGVPLLCSNYGGANELSKSDLFVFNGADDKDFICKLSRIINNPILLNEYWEKSRRLTTMDEHITELLKLYAK